MAQEVLSLGTEGYQMSSATTRFSWGMRSFVGACIRMEETLCLNLQMAEQKAVLGKQCVLWQRTEAMLSWSWAAEGLVVSASPRWHCLLSLGECFKRHLLKCLAKFTQHMCRLMQIWSRSLLPLELCLKLCHKFTFVVLGINCSCPCTWKVLNLM